MSIQQSRYSAEEIAQRGDDIYERQIRSKVDPLHKGRVVAIDVETGEYAVSDSALSASNLLRAKCSEPEIWFVRIGHRALHRIG